ncbi:hypothetical protein RclHR1_01920011 [Rhizophagus clarus]|uniref:Uncharacterized protein n=1 Tax=Rhizophagus clarus TaxID=94130 RepID=A0A2Z6QNU0_9GLOM|nr:hypothetical protein RclHR1_01920011 [Rhizophagus clarus]
MRVLKSYRTRESLGDEQERLEHFKNVADQYTLIIKNEDEDIINAIDKLTPEIIRNNQNAKLKNEDKKIVTTTRCCYIDSSSLFRTKYFNKEILRSQIDSGEIACLSPCWHRNEG